MNANEHIDSASEKFKEVVKPDKYHYQQKFKNLPFWLEESSYYFNLESNNQLVKKYYYYPRGSVISVNFGVNEGSEFSNLHFAVVLDKRDSPKKRTLTVIPLTSKYKTGRFSLGKEVFNQTSTLLQENILEVERQEKKLGKKIDEFEKNIQKLNEDVAIATKIISNSKIETDNFLKDLKQNNTHPSEEQWSQIEKLTKSMIKASDKLNKINQEIITLQKNKANLEQESKDQRIQQDELVKVLDIYKKYNKNTFARIEDITTISKLRIKRINSFDPSGKIRLSSEQMKAISDKIMQLYISNN